MILGVSGKKQSGKDLVGKIIQYLTMEDPFKPHIFYKDPQGGERYTLEEVLNKLPWSLERGSGWEIKKFADKLKDMVCLLIGCTRADLENEEFKNKELGEEWTKWGINGDGDFSMEDYGFSSSFEEAVKNARMSGESEGYITKITLTPRKILELLGTDCMRDIIHPNAWLNALFSDYSKEYCWIITDVRFPNEVKAIEDRGGIVIRVNRDNKYTNNIALGNKLMRDQYKYTGQPFSETALDNHKFLYTIENNGTIEELVEKVKTILVKNEII